jgi:carbon-monoxide dehydrogenase large subunit
MNENEGGWVGRSVYRREDDQLLRGRGQFVADMVLPNMVHAAFVRSPVAHGRIEALDLTAARAAPGVCRALSGADLGDDLAPIGGGQVATPRGWADRVEHRVRIPPQPIMPATKAHYVGEALAVIVADNRYNAEDAARAVAPEFDLLPVVPDCEAGLAEGAEILHPDLGTNLVGELGVEKGDTAAALAAAPRRIKRRFVHHRYAAMPMECRGVLAQYDRRTDSLTVWSSTQVVHWIRRELGRRLGLAEERIRVIAPDVGGGFGGKGHVYPEDLLIPYLAMKLDRPVMWIEDRIEHIQNSAHSRDTVHEAEIGFDDDGRITALDVSFIIDSGAYSPVGAGVAFNTVAHHIGPYEIPNFRAATRVVVTNRTPNAPYRGAGRPEAVFVTERLIDLVADELGMEPADIRRNNMIRPDQMPYEVGIPYRDGMPIVYDGGDYPGALDRALEELGGLAAFRERQAAARAEGRWLGIGMASYTEGTGVGPFEGATVKVDPTGKIAIAAGACPHGQGHRTVLAQVAADGWSVDMDDVVITLADTSAVTAGYGTIASRSAVTGSAAIIMASDIVKAKVIELAAHLLESSEADLEFRDGTVGVKGVPDMALSLREIADASQPGWGGRRPEGMEGGLEATAYFEPPTVTWTYATNAVIVEIDPETGAVTIERYVAVHDAGVLINPMIAEAQVVGGLVQGIGGGMMEELVYSDDCQLLTGNLADYVLPTAAETPPITVIHTETPSPSNPLGVKGLGEGGAIAPPVAIANAVCDALKSFKTEINATPVRSADIAREFLRGV